MISFSLFKLTSNFLAFNSFDKDHLGFVDVEHILQVYNADRHPDVLSGAKTPAQVSFSYHSLYIAFSEIVLG